MYRQIVSGSKPFAATVCENGSGGGGINVGLSSNGQKRLSSQPPVVGSSFISSSIAMG